MPGIMNVYLVGFMGAGKTEVGRRLAGLLRWTFVDLDCRIAARKGMAIPEIFRVEGEAAFRALESAELKCAGEGQRQVVAVGGGCFCSPENRAVIAGTGLSVWLDAPIELLHSRCSPDPGSRPLFSGIGEMAALLERRLPYYAGAQLRIQVAGRSVDDLARQIIRELSLSCCDSNGAAD